MSTYKIETWGCQMNEHDSERMAGLLNLRGDAPAADAADARVVVLNTCAVREKAEDKLYSRLGELRPLKEKNPGMIIAVAGCIGQMSGEAIFKRAPYVDLVLGPRAIKNLPALIERAKSQRTIDTNLYEDSVLFGYDSAARATPGKAWITVMEGCNKRCSFCIVPTTRGSETHRPFDELLDEAKRLADSGIVEIELLGQNVNAWVDENRTRDFADLCRAVARVPGIRRLRFMTSHPLHFTERIAAVMGEEPAMCPYLHLPVQSGSDRVLKLMKRGYTHQWFLDKIAMVREKVPTLSLSTDLIVAFPGETEEDFAESLRLVEEVRFDSLYSFLYSARPGTPAAEMEPVPKETGKARHMRLHEAQAAIQDEIMQRFTGAVAEVLVEGQDTHGEPPPPGRFRSYGHDRHGKIVVFTAPGPIPAGRLVNVNIEGASMHQLRGALSNGELTAQKTQLLVTERNCISG
jgi:tRNA-2-methylthio-N6-dimethylallyladenosine synthase